MSFIYPFEASIIFSQIFSYDVSLANFAVTSITETFEIGTLYALPDIFPFNSGITFPIADAASVEVGIILFPEDLPILKLF
jgi:hypothetical protein